MNPLELFHKESPVVAKAFDGLIEALKATQGLDGKTKQLIHISLQASLGNQIAIFYHVPMAKEAGASREEVMDAILITLTIVGLKGVASCLPVALEIFDKA